MSKLTKAELSKYKKLLSLTRKDGSGEHFADLEEFEDRMDKKYGSWSIIPVKRGERVYNSMISRGFKGTLELEAREFNSSNLILLISIFSIVICIVDRFVL